MYWGSLTTHLENVLGFADNGVALGHFTKIWEMAVLLIFLLQFLSILSNLVLAKIGARFWWYSQSGLIGPNRLGSGQPDPIRSRFWQCSQSKTWFWWCANQPRCRKMVHCCCAVLAQMNQRMVNMSTTMSLTAIDKRLMMKRAIALALLTLSQCQALTVMWWHYFGNFHQSQFKTRFWRCSQSILTKPDQLGSGQSIGIGPINQDWAQSIPIAPDQEPDFGDAPNFGDDLWRSENWHFPKSCWKYQILILCGVSLWPQFLDSHISVTSHFNTKRGLSSYPDKLGARK